MGWARICACKHIIQSGPVHLSLGFCFLVGLPGTSAGGAVTQQSGSVFAKVRCARPGRVSGSVFAKVRCARPGRVHRVCRRRGSRSRRTATGAAARSPRRRRRGAPGAAPGVVGGELAPCSSGNGRSRCVWSWSGRRRTRDPGCRRLAGRYSRQPVSNPLAC
jgi:hypothetical protein